MNGTGNQKHGGIIYLIRGAYVMLDTDVAALYGRTVRTINGHAVRDPSLFPPEEVFRLTRMETEAVLAQNPSAHVRDRARKGPIVYSEKAVCAMAGVLRGVPETEPDWVREAFMTMRRYWEQSEEKYLCT